MTDLNRAVVEVTFRLPLGGHLTYGGYPTLDGGIDVRYLDAHGFAGKDSAMERLSRLVHEGSETVSMTPAALTSMIGRAATFEGREIYEFPTTE